MEDSPDAEPIEVAQIPVPRTGEDLHVGYGHDGVSPYITLGQAGTDLVELDAESVLAALDALTTAIHRAHDAHCQRTGRLYAG